MYVQKLSDCIETFSVIKKNNQECLLNEADAVKIRQSNYGHTQII